MKSHKEAERQETEENEKTKKVNHKSIGEFEDGVYVLTDSEISWIYKHFNGLSMNRANHVADIKR